MREMVRERSKENFQIINQGGIRRSLGASRDVGRRVLWGIAESASTRIPLLPAEVDYISLARERALDDIAERVGYRGRARSISSSNRQFVRYHKDRLRS